MQTIIIGHKNPDMDSICSALAYAHFKRATGMENVIAGRAGNTNERIDHVLNKFGVKAPTYIADLSPTVSDVMESNVFSVRDSSPVHEAIALMEEHRFRGLPVTDADGKMLGLLSAFQITQYLFPMLAEQRKMRQVTASLTMMVESFRGKLLTRNAGAPDCVEELTLMIGAMAPATFSERLQRYDASRIVLLVGDREGIQREAIKHGVRAICVTGGIPVLPDILTAASNAGVCMLSSPHDTATTVLMARGAVEAGRMIGEKYLSFHPDTPLGAAKLDAAASNSFIFPIVEEQGKLIGVLSKSDFLKPVPRQLILVDHNELSQAVAGAEHVPVIEILDHHKIGGFSSHIPMLFWNNPVGSTSTIVALSYEQAGIEIPPPIAGLLMAGIISDTLNLTSPTATGTDVRILQLLAKQANCNPSDLADEIFSVGSPLLTMSGREAVMADCKEYAEQGERFTVSQIEELSLDRFDAKESELLEALESHRAKTGCYFSALLVTDINTQNSLLMVAGDEVFRTSIIFPPRSSHVWELDGIVSRKKQLLPYLLKRIASARARTV